jgi:2',3'-cyclic-nucleotide 2'-phosphodiesterase (5'-nucleotidase family)
MKRGLYVMLICAITFAFVSCGTKETETKGPSGLDTSDPAAVAQAAWQAIEAEDFDAYIALVHPDSRQRETREQWLESTRKMKQAPGFPTNPKLVITPQEEVNRAVAATEDLRLSMGMVFKDGRWWMD